MPVQRWRCEPDLSSWEEMGKWHFPEDSPLTVAYDDPQADFAIGYSHALGATLVVQEMGPRPWHRTLRTEFEEIRSFALSPDGTRVALARRSRTVGSPFWSHGDAGGELCVYEVSTGRRLAKRSLTAELRDRNGPEHFVRLELGERMVWPKESRVITLDKREGRVYLVERRAEDLAPLRELELVDEETHASLAVSADGDTLGVSWMDKSVAVIDVVAFAVRSRTELGSSCSFSGSNFALSPEGNRLVFWGDPNCLEVLDVQGGVESRSLSIPDDLSEVDGFSFKSVAGLRWPSGSSSIELLGSRSEPGGGQAFVRWTIPADATRAASDRASHVVIPVDTPSLPIMAISVDARGRLFSYKGSNKPYRELIAWTPSSGGVLWCRQFEDGAPLLAACNGAGLVAVVLDSDGGSIAYIDARTGEDIHLPEVR